MIIKFQNNYKEATGKEFPFSFAQYTGQESRDEKDEIVIDGASFTLQGTGAYDYRLNSKDSRFEKKINPESNNTGIYSNSQKLTITNLTITEFYCAIELEYSSDNQIINNNITDNFNGVVIFTSSKF